MIAMNLNKSNLNKNNSNVRMNSSDLNICPYSIKY